MKAMVLVWTINPIKATLKLKKESSFSCVLTAIQVTKESNDTADTLE